MPSAFSVALTTVPSLEMAVTEVAVMDVPVPSETRLTVTEELAVTVLSVGDVMLTVGAEVSLLLPDPLSLAHDTSSREGTKLTARVRMHQVNNDFRDFLLRMRNLSLRRVTS